MDLSLTNCATTKGVEKVQWSEVSIKELACLSIHAWKASKSILRLLPNWAIMMDILIPTWHQICPLVDLGKFLHCSIASLPTLRLSLRLAVPVTSVERQRSSFSCHSSASSRSSAPSLALQAQVSVDLELSVSYFPINPTLLRWLPHLFSSCSWQAGITTWTWKRCKTFRGTIRDFFFFFTFPWSLFSAFLLSHFVVIT